MDYNVTEIEGHKGVFLVCWKGTRTPVGAKVGRFEILHMRDGRAWGRLSEESGVVPVGAYERVVEFGRVSETVAKELEKHMPGGFNPESHAVLFGVKDPQ